MQSFEELKKRFPQLESTDIFSDGVAQHFKQKYTLCNITYGITDYYLSLNWHFFASSHGKGAVDEIGGMMKHHVWHRVRSRREFVNDALSVFQCANLYKRKLQL